MSKIILSILISFLIGAVVLIFPIYSPAVPIILLLNVIIFIAPQYFILFWLIIAGFSSSIQLPGGVTSYGAMNLIFMPSLILKICINYKKELFRFPIIRAYFIFLLIYFISIWYSPEPHFMCFRKYWTFVIPLLMGILATGAFHNSKTIEKYLKITLGFVAFLCLLSTAMFMMGKWKLAIVSAGDVDRAEGFFSHPNLYAMYLNLHFGVSLSLAMFLKKRKDQIYYYVISFILCLSLLPTFAKGAYITCFLIIFFLSILSISLKRQVKQAFITLGFLIFIVLFGLIFFHSTLAHRFNSQQTLLWRITLWEGLIRYILQSPIWGHGYLSFFHITGDVLGISAGFSPHNQYIAILLDTGFLGLFAFLFTYLGMLIYALRVFASSPSESFIKALSLGLAISIVSTLFNSFTELSLFTPMINLYFWIYSGFLVAFVNIEKKASLKIYE